MGSEDGETLHVVHDSGRVELILEERGNRVGSLTMSAALYEVLIGGKRQKSGGDDGK